ncbi:MAG: TonB family protein [Deltaproteobacteria bacterium]|nr:TonB family protein [Deltaproteobacteria bacterium]
MNCREVRERLAESPEAASEPAVAEHLASCSRCRSLAERLAAVDEALGEMDAREPPRDLVQRTLERIERQDRRRQGRTGRVLAWATLGVPIVLLIAVGFLSVAGDNVRALFSSSANALSGQEAGWTDSAGRPYPSKGGPPAGSPGPGFGPGRPEESKSPPEKKPADGRFWRGNQEAETATKGRLEIRTSPSATVKVDGKLQRGPIAVGDDAKAAERSGKRRIVLREIDRIEAREVAQEDSGIRNGRDFGGEDLPHHGEGGGFGGLGLKGTGAGGGGTGETIGLGRLGTRGRGGGRDGFDGVVTKVPSLGELDKDDKTDDEIEEIPDRHVKLVLTPEPEPSEAAAAPRSVIPVLVDSSASMDEEKTEKNEETEKKSKEKTRALDRIADEIGDRQWQAALEDKESRKREREAKRDKSGSRLVANTDQGDTYEPADKVSESGLLALLGKDRPVPAKQPQIMGSLSRSIIQRVVHGELGQIQACYERELVRNPKVGGKLSVQFAIQPTGQVAQAQAESSSTGSAELDACVTRAVQRMRFPAPKGGGMVMVSYPFTFRSVGLGGETGVVEHHSIDRRMLERSVSDPSGVATQARIVPAFQDGQATGFKVFGIRPGSLYDGLGIENGDVLHAINGQPLSSPDKALSIYQGLKGESKFELDVTRRGEHRKLVFEIDGEPDYDEVAIEGLRFIPASGYFKNTYLPGDPSMEWLRQRLARGLFMDGEHIALQEEAVQYSQPFDSPDSDGLALYLDADRCAVEGPSRVTVQVGLKGSERHARRRAPLNAALVVDLRALADDEARRGLWSVAGAMAGSVQAGDRFFLLAAGPGEPLLLEPGRFEPTAVKRALAEALLGMEGAEPRPGSNLAAACQRAYALLQGAGSEDAPLGANLVLLATAGSPGSERAALETMAHARALEGVSLTAIGVGPGADRAALAELAWAGQGRRRLVASTDDARPVIEAELAASGSVVARALRLRIRLAEGVKLVAVLGSEPLTATASQRVREAEQAIDRRISRTLGIEADRGEDEEGIQIVIPAYYAGDAHVILLDLVVPGPGPVADVRVRYKDLVKLSNAVARASLSLPAGRRPLDPLAVGVRKNRLAHELARALEQASEKLEAGQASPCRQILARAQRRIEHLQAVLHQLAGDEELARDARMLAAYQRVLASQDWQGDEALRRHLVHSLVYAGRKKLSPESRD